MVDEEQTAKATGLTMKQIEIRAKAAGIDLPLQEAIRKEEIDVTSAVMISDVSNSPEQSAAILERAKEVQKKRKSRKKCVLRLRNKIKFLSQIPVKRLNNQLVALLSTRTDALPKIISHLEQSVQAAFKVKGDKRVYPKSLREP